MKNLAYTKILEGNWEELKGEVQSKWGELTDNDLDKINGSYKKLIGRLQKVYGYTLSELEDEIVGFFEMSKFDKMKDSAVKKINEVREIVTTTLDDYFQSAKDTVNDSEEAIVDYIRENPIKSIGIAAATGLLLTCLIKKLR
jgi:uncharacterized protein YjbJ (UPF0337 family)